jgi:hypothetical protein
VSLADADRRLRELIEAIPAPLRSAPIVVLEAPEGDDRARAIGDLHATGLMPETVELLIDAEEDSSGYPTISALSARASAIAMTASVHRDPWILAKTTCPPTGTRAATCPPFAPPPGYSGNR